MDNLKFDGNTLGDGYQSWSASEDFCIAAVVQLLTHDPKAFAEITKGLDLYVLSRDPFNLKLPLAVNDAVASKARSPHPPGVLSLQHRWRFVDEDSYRVVEEFVPLGWAYTDKTKNSLAYSSGTNSGIAADKSPVVAVVVEVEAGEPPTAARASLTTSGTDTFGISDLIEMEGCPRRTAYRKLQAMVGAGTIVKVSRGRYAFTEQD